MKKNADAEFNLEIEHVDTGIPVPVSLKISYPKNHGLYIIKAITALHERTDQLASEMISSGDASVIQALMEDRQANGEPHG